MLNSQDATSWNWTKKYYCLLLLKEKGLTDLIFSIHSRPHALTAFLMLALALIREVRPHSQEQDPILPAGQALAESQI